MMMNEKGRTIQFWRVADGRPDVVIPLRSARSSDALTGGPLHRSSSNINQDNLQ
jgi:hypothetical protein